MTFTPIIRVLHTDQENPGKTEQFTLVSDEKEIALPVTDRVSLD